MDLFKFLQKLSCRSPFKLINHFGSFDLFFSVPKNSAFFFVKQLTYIYISIKTSILKMRHIRGSLWIYIYSSKILRALHINNYILPFRRLHPKVNRTLHIVDTHSICPQYHIKRTRPLFILHDQYKTRYQNTVKCCSEIWKSSAYSLLVQYIKGRYA
jgi:hypothetical protein